MEVDMKLRVHFQMRGLLLAILATLVSLSACGNNTTLPSDGTITLDPTSYTLTALSVIPDVCIPINVIAKFNDGSPMEQAAIDIYGPFASPDSGMNVYQFYDGACPADPARARNAHFTGATDETGVYTFSILINGASGTWFDKNISVSSGIASATFELEKN
jgi:hypothetical protein